MFFLSTFFKILLIVVPLLIAVAYFTLAERKLLGVIQRRKGPNVIGIFGLLQPLSDGFKLLIKETIIPSSSNKILFVLSPIFTFFLSIVGWGVIPFGRFSILVEMNVSVLYLFAVSSLGIYGVIFSGWSSNSKYAFLGALRSTAQMVSYEVSIGFIMINVAVCCGSLNLQNIILCQEKVWFFFPFFPLFLIFIISGLAETNRHPFDLPEAEAELVSGYNVEYSAMGFALFSLGEYANMLMMSALISILFLGGWFSPFFVFSGSFFFSLKICFFVVLWVWARAALPRYRYDQLMFLGWKVFLPVSLGYLLFCFCVLLSSNILPY